MYMYAKLWVFMPLVFSLNNETKRVEIQYRKKRGFAEAPAQEFGEKGGKTNKTSSYCYRFSSLPCLSPFSPFLCFLLPTKKGREILGVYFRFLMIQNPAITATATIMAAAIMASSVVTRCASVDATVAVSVGSGAIACVPDVGSGSIGCAGIGASSTIKYVSAYEP